MITEPDDVGPGLNFDLSKSQLAWQQKARTFARQDILPVAKEYDERARFPWPVVKKAQKLGLTSLNVPRAYGGAGVTLLEEVLVTEELAWACSGIGLAITLNTLAALPVLLAGSEAQQENYLGRLGQGQMAAFCVTEPEAGSDVSAIQTTARREGDHYLLDGVKTFISNAPVADWYTIFASTEPDQGYKGLSAFIVERSSPGLTVSEPFEKLGQRASPTGQVRLDKVRVPVENRLGAEGEGFKLIMQVFDHSRPHISALALGVARRALEEATEFARQRMSMGKPIYKHQAVGHLLAEMATQIDAARLLIWRAAWLADQGRKSTKEASMAKAYAPDIAMQACVDAVQVLGGYGYLTDYPVEKLLRDIKVCQIYEGTSQIQRSIIVRELFG